jgi:hypothetical protein
LFVIVTSLVKVVFPTAHFPKFITRFEGTTPRQFCAAADFNPPAITNTTIKQPATTLDHTEREIIVFGPLLIGIVEEPRLSKLLGYSFLFQLRGGASTNAFQEGENIQVGEEQWRVRLIMRLWSFPNNPTAIQS